MTPGDHVAVVAPPTPGSSAPASLSSETVPVTSLPVAGAAGAGAGPVSGFQPYRSHQPGYHPAMFAGTVPGHPPLPGIHPPFG